MNTQRLKSPGEAVIHVALLSSHSIVIGPEGRDVPQNFVRDALIAGAIPDSMQASDLDSNVPASSEKARADLIKQACKKMLNAGADLTGNGMVNLKDLAKEVGFQVTKEELTVIWQELEAEAGQ